ncbi:DUF3611 family protein [Roseofilum sp. BLCC_M91]|uniref:DUF3611 family protein n=1 Tax=Roseofilum halophilum BLCC-M91 TaxID=3022259 RepID=A0ABT7BNT6_9CYAN|nr:DUF3611 family protein [Roseofilum halophilum]MDJ1180821.1 DUF3611 family protein [Roseofilum halophilum BLCC-M91]
MPDNDQFYALPPAVEKFSGNLRLTAWISFWTQVVLGAIATIIFLFALIGKETRAGVQDPGRGGGAFFAICGLLVLYFSIVQAFRYTRLARQLRSPDSSVRPSKATTIQMIKFGLVCNIVGMSLSLLAAEAITGILLGKSLFQPQGLIPTGADLGRFIEPIDLFVLLGNTHTTVSHFVSIVGSLWLLNVINRPKS